MKIAVVGAGIGGLVAAWRLQEAGHDVDVFEAASHPGGRMWSEHVDGFDIDLGAHMLLDTFDRTRALIRELGLEDRWFELEPDKEGGILHDHHVSHFAPKTAFDVLRFRDLGWKGRVGLFLALVEARRWHEDLDFFDLSLGDDELDTQDCDTYARRRMGDEATDYVVDSFIRTFHFCGARKMSRKYFEALAALLIDRGQFRPCALRGHMRTLPTALSERLHVRYRCPVDEVESGADSVQLRWAGGEVQYEAVVVATTAKAAHTLIRSQSHLQRGVLDHAAYTSTALCAYVAPIDRVGDFEGNWIPFLESRIVAGISNETNKGARKGERCVLSVWLHEEGAATLLPHSDQELLATVAAEVEHLFPRFAGQLEPLNLQRWTHALPVYGVGQVTRVKHFWEKAQGQGGVWLCGDYLNHPWVEGTVRCAEKVAQRIGVD